MALSNTFVDYTFEWHALWFDFGIEKPFFSNLLIKGRPAPCHQ
jgi:hypothetical protein